jgi:hypothetical protein
MVLDPKGTGESYNITTYEMKDWAKPHGYAAAFHKLDSQVLESVRSNKDLTYLILYSVSPVIKRAFSAELKNDESHLLKRGKNIWTIVASWPSPDKKR